ncbi:MAG: hypothetical protein KW802_02560 [Candidatus Doudnabacteria bacterium]|nr:hypothetical protein [Candidatus Doudnabacteria bacterium]
MEDRAKTFTYEQALMVVEQSIKHYKDRGQEPPAMLLMQRASYETNLNRMRIGTPTEPGYGHGV